MTKIAVYLSDRFADWECALTMAAARAYYGMDVITLSENGENVTSAGGLNVAPDVAANALDWTGLTALLIPGGSIWSTPEAPDISQLLHKAKSKNILIAAICDANLALAQADLLNDTPHTGNALDAFEPIQNYRGATYYVDTPDAVSAPNLVTAAGTAPVSFMRCVMAQLGQDANELAYYAGLYALEHAHSSGSNQAA